MARTCDLAVIVGSLAQASLNRRMAGALIGVAPPSLRPAFVEIGELPLYTPDFEADPPPAVRAFRERVAPCDAVLFVTPESNRSMPGGLKNALDVGSRPYGKSVWAGKPAAIVTCSPGAIGGFGANHHLRQSLVFLNVPCLQMPEVYVGAVHQKFDESGKPKDEETRKFLQKFIDAYAAWVARNVTGA
jgi:chromate reductase